MIEDGYKISELNNASELLDTDLIPIVSGGTTYNITASDFKGNLSALGSQYLYSFSGLKTNQGSSNWHTCYDNLTTGVLPKGRYLFIFNSTFTRYDGNTGIALHTIRPIIDGTTHDARCTSVITNLTSTLQITMTRYFSTEGTHTINVEGYGQANWNLTGSNYVDIIRIR